MSEANDIDGDLEDDDYFDEGMLDIEGEDEEESDYEEDEEFGPVFNSNNIGNTDFNNS